MSEWHITIALFAVWVVLRLRRIPTFVRLKKAER